MNQKDIFRMAMVLGNGSASNFNTNLLKIIKLILFDDYGNKLTIVEIINALKEKYTLEFSYDEIEKLLKKEKDIVIFKEGDHTCNRYTINPKQYEKMKELDKVNIDDYITQFLNNTENKYEFSKLKELIYRFLYLTFNEDKKTVLELMNLVDINESHNIIDEKFDPDESRMINEFLNWDYKPKNEFILNLIASCFDYCMLTVKKNTGSFSNLFNGKVFYLDSNIIFRLAGFNNEERKNVMSAFIRKCENSGIKICYTNITEAELINTISYHVKSLKKMLGNNRPLSINAMRTMGSKYANFDFYEQYSTWCDKKENNAGDFEKFKKYLNREIRKILNGFRKVVITKDYSSDKRYNFDEFTMDFSDYKAKNYRNTYIGAIKTDINNYLYMIEQNNKGQSSNFLDTKNYFITADHCLTDWALSKRPATVPIFVLPSVWYSILLKYKGRTEDDYKAFCQFLNIRIAPEKDRLKEIKEKIFPYIMDLNETQEIKEEIIYDIEEKLNNIEIIDENIDVEKIVRDSHNTIVEQSINELETKYNKDIGEINKQLYEAKRQINEQEKDIGKQKDIIEQIAREKSRKNNLIIKVVTIICIIGILIVIIGLFICMLSDEKKGCINWFNKNQGICAVIFFLLSMLSVLFRLIISKTDFLTTDIPKIEEKLKEKYKNM